MAISDGSYFPIERLGAFAWIVANPDGEEWVEGGGVIPGKIGDQNSYRSELGGQLGIHSFASSLILPPGLYVINIVCDGISALNRGGIEIAYIKYSAK